MSESQPSGEFEKVYSVHGSDALRWIPAPFRPERKNYYPPRPEMPAPCCIKFSWREGKLHADSATYGRLEARDLIRHLLNVHTHEMEGDISLLHTHVQGDLLVQSELIPDRVQSALGNILSQIAGAPVTLRFRQVQRHAIVFHGIWRPTPLIDIYGLSVTDPRIDRGHQGSATDFARSVGEWINHAVIIETEPTPAHVQWTFRHPREANRQTAPLLRDPHLTCKHIEEQTGMTFSEETRTVTRLFVERSGGSSAPV